MLWLLSTLTKKCSIPNSDTKFCNYTIIGGTWAMVSISHFHTLPPTILSTLQQGRSTVEWTRWRQHRNANNVWLFICHFGSFRNSVWLKIWQPWGQTLKSKSGLPDWLFWSYKPEICLFSEAVGSKNFICLFGYFLALLQLFHSTNFSWRRVVSDACSLSRPP